MHIRPVGATWDKPCLVMKRALMQERIRIPDDKMAYYTDLAEMYVGDDVSPDFYGWVFPKYDHVAVGTGTVVNKAGIKQYQLATRARSKGKTEGGKIIRVEAHPIPEHPRPRRCKNRVALVGDAAGVLRPCPSSFCTSLQPFFGICVER